MADIKYPHDYLPMPLQDGYAFTPTSPLLRSTKVNGRAQQRRAYTSVPTQVAVSWFMNAQEAMLFESWFQSSITDGADWFIMKLQTPLGLQDEYQCRFTDIYQGPNLVAPNYWKFTATLELKKRPILPDGYGEFPDYVINASIFDLAMNREWPEA